MKAETWSKRFHISMTTLRYISDPKLVYGKNGKLYQVRLNKKGLPIANLLTIMGAEAGSMFPKNPGYEDNKDEFIHFT